MPEYTDLELIRDQEKLNEHNAEHAGADYDGEVAYRNHPMTDTQAKSLMSRIRTAFEYRNGLIRVDQQQGDIRWKNADSEALTISVSNIDAAKKPGTNEYNIEAGDDTKDGIDEYDTMPEASLEYLNIVIKYIGENVSIYQKNKFYKCVEDSGSYSWIEFDPIDTSSANIIKAIDGIAIINSILRINEIDNDIDNIADESCKRIIKAINNGLSYTDSTKQYLINNIIHVDVYPNGTTDTDIVNAKTKYANVILINTDTDDFNFNSDDPTDRANQKEYIISVLEDITDIIKYVKTFTTFYVEAYADGSDAHQNITSAFDYYVLDYIVQMIEAENELFATLLAKYEKFPMAPDERRLKRDLDLKTIQHKQNNHAPFVGSMCNGSCVGLCYGSCITTCNGCGGCASYCSTYCGASCYDNCGTSACTSTCNSTCKDSCQGYCERTCTITCGDTCTSSCITGCKGQCKGECDTSCSNTCRGQCVSGCIDGCAETCMTSCGQSCQSTSASKNKISSPNPVNYRTETD